ncbi:hypothetical protein [Paracoccus seriniphilus]|uniref:PEP-CTERM protein-sorting domain-containing protein n=1 Tax=Paracoccus seriniphilus TaxID=184748 RepID=A0A239Q1J4_9RHOB|nr:hypothetical protein [Paracoccus seriniphilus]WCR13258.1 hypothetical protein JHW44_09925 [Paracoccus seriniphilus]SNT76459.1 hypothetical protein SAMN05444959_12026 [Paracoccus seriniphilus]
MIVILALLIGMTVGWYRAARLGGVARDKVQYAAAFGLAFAMLGLFATVIIERLA